MTGKIKIVRKPSVKLLDHGGEGEESRDQMSIFHHESDRLEGDDTVMVRVSRAEAARIAKDNFDILSAIKRFDKELLASRELIDQELDRVKGRLKSHVDALADQVLALTKEEQKRRRRSVDADRRKRKRLQQEVTSLKVKTGKEVLPKEPFEVRSEIEADAIIKNVRSIEKMLTNGSGIA